MITVSSLKTYVRIWLCFLLVQRSVQDCKIVEKKVRITTYSYFEKTLYSYIECTDIDISNNPKNEIMKVSNNTEKFPYVQIIRSNIPTIKHGIFTGLNFTELRIKESKVRVIGEGAFRNANITVLNLEDNKINTMVENCFNSTMILELSLNNNSLEVIYSYDFRGLTELRKLSLQNNHIKSIQPNSLKDLTALQQLDLSYNVISNLDANTFATLENIQGIYLNNNELKSVDKNIFAKNQHLQYIHFDNNYLSSLDSTSFPKATTFINASNNNLRTFNFSNLPNLETIDVSNNKLSTTRNRLNNLSSLKFFHANQNNFGRNINKESLVHLKNLTIVELNNNSLYDLDFKIFSNENKLNIVSLAQNFITTVNLSECCFSILNLNLSSNRIMIIEHISKLTNLSSLDLSNNQIKTLTYDMFEGCKSLKYLNLDNNAITEVHLGCFRDLQGLTELHLSHNYLSTLTFGIFNGLNSLIELDLSYNNLSNFDEDTFHSTKRLRKLDLSFNHLNNLNVRRILPHINWLSKINLNGNNWSCNALAALLRENKVVELIGGTSHNVTNVFGVACTNDENPGYYDRTQYVIDLTKSMNATLIQSRDISAKMSVNNTVLILLLVLILINVILKIGRNSNILNRFIFQNRSEQEMHLIQS